MDEAVEIGSTANRKNTTQTMQSLPQVNGTFLNRTASFQLKIHDTLNDTYLHGVIHDSLHTNQNSQRHCCSPGEKKTKCPEKRGERWVGTEFQRWEFSAVLDFWNACSVFTSWVLYDWHVSTGLIWLIDCMQLQDCLSKRSRKFGNWKLICFCFELLTWCTYSWITPKNISSSFIFFVVPGAFSTLSVTSPAENGISWCNDCSGTSSAEKAQQNEERQT